MAFLGEVEQKQIYRGHGPSGRVVPAALLGGQTLYHLADIVSDRSARVLAEAWANRNPYSNYASGSYENHKGEKVPAVFRADLPLQDIAAGRVTVARRQGGVR